MTKQIELIKKHKKTIIFLAIFVGLLYSYYIMHELTNVGDGFWQQSFHYAGDSERASGRWIWPYIDMIQCGLHMEPINMLFSLFIFISGYIILIDLLDLEDGLLSCFGGAIFFSTPIFSAITAYRFMSIIYAMAFLFSVLAVYFCIALNKKYWSVLGASLCISFSMGLYQAYVGVFCLIGITYVLLNTWNKKIEKNKLIQDTIVFIVSFLAGGLLYFVSLKTNLKLTHTSLSNYNGVNDISVVSILKSLPTSILKTYVIFKSYICGNMMKQNILDKLNFTFIFHIVLLVLISICCIFAFTKLTNIKIFRIVMTFICLILLPIVCCISKILAPESEFMPQVGGTLALCSGLLFIITMKLVKQYFPWNSKILLGVLIICCILEIYGQTMQVLIDHKAMQDGYVATVSFTNGLLNDLQKNGELSSHKQYFFIGSPANNPLFYRTENFNKANDYARIGDFWLSGTNMYASYSTLFHDVMGVNLDVLCDNYESKAYEEFYQSMPIYPQDGYYVSWDTTIVKISEP